MATEKLYSERQRFTQIWLWIILICIDALFIYGLVSQLFLRRTFGDKPMSNPLLIFITSGLLLLTFLFVIARLDTYIQKEGIFYRFFPLQWAYRKISWDRIMKSFVRQYNPIGEYGGWGLRIGLFGKGQALNVAGNKGLQLLYDDGKKLLIGTQRPEEIKQVLKQLGRLTVEN